MRAVSPERLLGIVLRRRADVAPLGVEDQRDVRVRLAYVAADPLERLLFALAGEVGDLRLERAHQVGGGVDDRLAERLDRTVDPVERERHARRIGIEPDAQHRPR